MGISIDESAVSLFYASIPRIYDLFWSIRRIFEATQWTSLHGIQTITSIGTVVINDETSLTFNHLKSQLTCFFRAYDSFLLVMDVSVSSALQFQVVNPRNILKSPQLSFTGPEFRLFNCFRCLVHFLKNNKTNVSYYYL